ncbi:TMV resistance protein N-like [Senna tora]|uniref:TMV resistance protein N-like n=1 Tax=Senna tora TaxID=362788 RepID=A0A834VYV1_9FABA|nr:TMV resistance protein N-like [Senna tora]
MLGSRVGEVVMVEELILNGRVLRNFARARVLVDLSKSIVKGFWISRLGLPRVWISVRFEKLQHYYFNCGIVGYEVKRFSFVGRIGGRLRVGVGRGLK